LLIAVEEKKVDQLIAELKFRGTDSFAVIGEAVADNPGFIAVL